MPPRELFQPPPRGRLPRVKTSHPGDHDHQGNAMSPTAQAINVETHDIELALPARAENVAIVRHAFGALGEAYELTEQMLSDLRLAVTEACTNVVLHAYPEDVEGPLEVRASIAEEQLTVVVRDHGRGITPRPDSPGLGLGLPLIASLADTVQLGRDEAGHTEVRMGFSLRRLGEAPSGGQE